MIIPVSDLFFFSTGFTRSRGLLSSLHLRLIWHLGLRHFVFKFRFFLFQFLFFPVSTEKAVSVLVTLIAALLVRIKNSR